ncbi:hypothetical protein [Dactylosporangium sp. CA-139066]|uniref:hypothetical protein n=1 Tax=Dactylosporangium sp. CA-139066 TaxID=3239930 RepID=UPI003D8F25A7
MKLPISVRRLRVSRRVLTMVLALALLCVVAWRYADAAGAAPNYRVPHDPQMENALGVRFTQAAVVADGGLVELRYVVLDTQKGSAFQNDTKHPPLLTNERSGKTAWRAALMKQGHELRPGQSYYILYLNNANAIKRGDDIEIQAGPHRLAHVRVR